MSRFLLSSALVITMGGSVVALNSVLSSVPAFNGHLRVENVYGSEQAPVPVFMYDHADYLLQTGYSFVRADILPSAETEALGESADIDTALERGLAAVSLIEASVSLDPGNALAWEALAWAYMMTGEIEAAHVALTHSWTLAPINRALAGSRLSLAAGLFIDEELPELALSMNEKDRASMMHDLTTVSRFDTRNTDFYLDILAPLGFQAD